MKFSCGKTDTLYVGIESDEDRSNSHLTFKCSAHEHKEITGIVIGLEDGTYIETFREDDFDISDNHKLKYIPLSYLLFETQVRTTACLRIKTKTYFIEHFYQVKK